MLPMAYLKERSMEQRTVANTHPLPDPWKLPDEPDPPAPQPRNLLADPLAFVLGTSLAFVADRLGFSLSQGVIILCVAFFLGFAALAYYLRDLPKERL